MQIRMTHHIEETFASVIALSAYLFAHFTGMKFTILQSNITQVPFNLHDKLINAGFGVLTAIVAYFAVYFIKKYITHEK